jgi:predicted SAM-dependent methyltransferase
MSLRINLGSGQRKFGNGFINVDSQPKWEPDVLADANSMPMFENGSAELIVLHQVYEHFGLGELNGCIGECYRILQSGGSLIVTTPDLNELTRAWIKGSITDYIFCVNLYGAYMSDEADRHKWLYTGKTLAESLTGAAAWRTVKSFDWREILGASICKDWWILGVEAVK